MLRIETQRHGTGYSLHLHGAIAGEGLGVLERHWRAILGKSPSARVKVVLVDVPFIAADGEALLHQMAEAGVEFEGAGVMNRYVIDKISH